MDYPEWALRMYGTMCARSHVQKMIGAQLLDRWYIIEDKEILVGCDTYMKSRATNATVTRCGLEMIVTLAWLRNVIHRAVDVSIYVQGDRFVLGDFSLAKYSETRCVTQVPMRTPPPNWGQPYHQDLDFWLLGVALKRWCPPIPTTFLRMMVDACLDPDPRMRLRRVRALGDRSEVTDWRDPVYTPPLREPMPGYTLTYGAREAQRLREAHLMCIPGFARMTSVIQSGWTWHTTFDTTYVPLVSTRLSEPAIARFRVRLREVVRACHEYGIMIRNLCPKTVLVDESGDVQLVDLSVYTRIRPGWVYTAFPEDHYRDPRMIHGNYDETVDFFSVKRICCELT